MMRLVIARHGNTFDSGEPPRRIGSRTDLPLTTTGRQQGEALGAHFAANGFRFSTVVCGALQRTREMAALILAAQTDTPLPRTADFLTEIDHGPDENQPEDIVLSRIGAKALEAWDRDATPPPGWQVDAEIRIAAWRAFAAEITGDVLAVTSNGAARFALTALLPVSEWPAAIKLRTGSYGIITSDMTGGYHLSVWNSRPEPGGDGAS